MHNELGYFLQQDIQASVDAEGWHDCCEGPGSTEGKYINWLTIKEQSESVLEDVTRIKASSMVPSDIPVYGYIYDCKSGRLIKVPAGLQDRLRYMDKIMIFVYQP